MLTAKGLRVPGKEAQPGDVIMLGVWRCLLSAHQPSLSIPGQLLHCFLNSKGEQAWSMACRCYHGAIVQDLDEIPKREAVRAIKHCAWEVKSGLHDCAALEGSFSYYAFSWNAGMPVLHLMPCQ